MRHSRSDDVSRKMGPEEKGQPSDSGLQSQVGGHPMLAQIRFCGIHNLTAVVSPFLPSSETYPSGRMVKTSYDGGDRISSVYIQGGTTYASALSYAPPEAVASMTLGNGLVETTAYNDRLQPTSIAAGMLATFT